MADTFLLEILTPERLFFQDQIEMMIIDSTNGQVGILPHHADMAAAIKAGSLRIKRNDSWTEVFASDGFIEVLLGAAHVLVQTAEWPDEIDRHRAEGALQRAKELMEHKKNQKDFIRAKASIARALARMRVFDETHNQKP